MAAKYPSSPTTTPRQDKNVSIKDQQHKDLNIAKENYPDVANSGRPKLSDPSIESEQQCVHDQSKTSEQPFGDVSQPETVDGQYWEGKSFELSDTLLEFLKHSRHTAGTATTVNDDKLDNKETQCNIHIEGNYNTVITQSTILLQPRPSDKPEGHAELLNLQNCQEELRTSYLDSFGRINLLQWIPEATKEMESIFVNLQLVRKEGNSYHNIQFNEELVNLTRSNGQRVKRVLVSGDAGSGKSTLLSNIAYKWALNDPQSPLSKFSMVFVLRMKDIESSSSLVDLIFQDSLPEDTRVSKEKLRAYIRENAQDVLFLIDGLDENSSGVLTNESGEVSKILRDKIQRESCVILTTRPESVTNLKEYASHYLEINLEGFSISSTRDYIAKFFKHDQDKRFLLLKKLDQDPHIEALASIPVLLLMICILWDDHRYMPKTKTQLYKQTIRYMWKRYKAKANENPLSGDLDTEEFKPELKVLLGKLGTVALKHTSILERRFTFAEQDFSTDECSLGCKVGFLKKEIARSGLERKTSICFLHATFQEFFAAFSFTLLLESKEAQLDDFHGKSFSIYAHASVFLEFCCGLKPEITTSFFQYHLHAEQEKLKHGSPGCVIPMQLHLANIFESQLSFDQCAKLRKMIPTVTSYCSTLIITHNDIPRVLYLLDLYRSSGSVGYTGILSAINKLNLALWYTPSWIPYLLTFTTNLHLYIHQRLTGDSENHDKLYKALSGLQRLSIFQFLCSPGLDLFRSSGLPDITKLIKYFTEKDIRLSNLCLGGFRFDDKVMARYLLNIKTSITSLILDCTRFFDEEPITANEVMSILPALKQLSKLRLPFFHISSGIKHLEPIISQLEHLDLRKCGLEEKQFKELLSFLSRAKKLRVLNLSYNPIFSGSLVGSFVDTLNKHPVLKELGVIHSGLSEESKRTLINFAKKKPLRLVV